MADDLPPGADPTRPAVDDSADTSRFRAFAERREEPPPKAVGVPFRLLTLAAGLLAFALVVVWLLRG